MTVERTTDGIASQPTAQVTRLRHCSAHPATTSLGPPLGLGLTMRTMSRLVRPLRLRQFCLLRLLTDTNVESTTAKGMLVSSSSWRLLEMV